MALTLPWQAEFLIATVANEPLQQQEPLLARAYYTLAKIAMKDGLHYQSMVWWSQACTLSAVRIK